MKSYALSLVALLAFLSCAPVCQARDFELVIAHVNDTHSHAAGTDRFGNAAYDQESSPGGAARLAAAGVFSLFAAYFKGFTQILKPQIHSLPASRCVGKLGCANAKARFCLRE